MDNEEARAKFLGEAEAVFERLWSGDAERSQATLDDMAAELAPQRQELMGELLGKLLGKFVQQHWDGRYEEWSVQSVGRR